MNLEELARQAGYSVSPMCGIAFPQHGAEDETELLARFAALVLEEAAKIVDAAQPMGKIAATAAAIRALKPVAS